jgi:hypothetical protein
MRSSWMCMNMGLDGDNRGAGNRSQKLAALSILMIILSIITLSDYGMHQKDSQVNLDKEIPFKCTSCTNLVWFKIRDLQKMFKPITTTGPAVGPTATGPATTMPTTNPADRLMGPMMGPMTLDCPKCHKKTLTQAVACPKCNEIFVMKMDPKANLFDDKCPKCHESYAKAWQEKYRKEKGK